MQKQTGPLIQYILIREDLKKQWATGSLIAQGCHAAVAVTATNFDHINVRDYLHPNNITGMRKIVLGIKDDQSIYNLSQTLTDSSLIHHVWIEQPENIPTAIALLPYPKDTVHPLLSDYKLLR